ncbi:MAG TPA: P-loop NTPase [Pirellulales bacterium]|nr:P-loop NTPase [Pirellulales bacterium]
MHDQADHLRRLMRGTRQARAGVAASRSIVAVGAKGGVGTTTIAVNLAVSLARRGQDAVLVDGDLGKADAGALCGLGDGPTVVDVLAGRRRVEDVLQPGPADVRVLPGAWATGHLTDCDAAAQQRLLDGLAGLSGITVIDAGCGLHRVLERFWRSADHVLLVTTPDDTSLMDAYACLKTLFPRHGDVPVHVVVNGAADQEQCRETHARLARAGRRFLGIDLPCAAQILTSADVAAAGQRRIPFVRSAPACQATRSMEQLAQFFEIAAASSARMEAKEKFGQRIQALHA